MNTGTMVDNGAEQQSDNAQGNKNDNEHDNYHGKAKTYVSSPNYHPYSRN